MTRHAHLIGTGTRALGSQLLDWVAAGTRRASAGRLAGLAAAGWMLGGMVIAAPGMLALVAAAWLVAGWRAGRDVEQREANQLAFVQLLRNLIGDRNGVLLSAVVAVLQERNPDVELAHVRAQCEALGVPVRDKLKVDGSVSVGVHVDDLLGEWDVRAAPPPGGPRVMHPAVNSGNYPTTPDREGSPEGVGCSPQLPDEQLVGDDFEDHLADALDILQGRGEVTS